MFSSKLGCFNLDTLFFGDFRKEMHQNSSVVFLTSACLLVLYFKQGLFKRWRDSKVEKEESNNVYGLYYTEDGQQIDQGTVEVVDVNHYYG